MTGVDLLLLIVRSLVATIGAAYFVVTGFIQPALHHRDRLWSKRWTGLAFGVIAIAVGSVLISILEKKGDHNNRSPLGRELHFVAAVLALRFLHPLEASLRFPTSSTNSISGSNGPAGKVLSPGECDAGFGGPNAPSAPAAMHALTLLFLHQCGKSIKRHLPVWNLIGSYLIQVGCCWIL